MSVIMSRRDLDFVLFEWLDTAELLQHKPFDEHTPETVASVLDLAEQLSTDLFAPHNRLGDLQEPSFDGTTVHVVPEAGVALKAFAEAGFVAAALPEAVGGMQVPASVFSAALSWFHAANAGTGAYALLTTAAANLIAHHGDSRLRETFVPPMLDGHFFGTMALSEPQAGSSLADITTRAEPQDDGSYRVFGRKMWISGGDHELSDNIVHLVLARTPGAPAGTRGISLFLVPKYLVAEDGSRGERNDVTLAGINHKMGYRGTVNTAPVFGDGAFQPGGLPGAVGYLIGSEGSGLPIMFTMMNEARIGVGLGATALATTGYLKSLAYARERLQGRPVGTGPGSPQVPLVEHPDIRRMLLAQKAYAEGALALVLYAARLVDDAAAHPDRADEANAVLGLLTPIVKSWPSMWGPRANDLAIQILGGAGYTRDHDIEQHYRDNRLNPIHEGTHGIQALDLLGRKVLMDQGRALGLLGARMADTVQRAQTAGGQAAEYAALLAPRVARLGEVTKGLAGLDDPAAVTADASLYLDAAGHIVVAWLWLDQLLAVADKDGPFYDGKRSAAAYFFRRELPTVDPLLNIIAASDRVTLDLDASVL